MPNEMEMGRFEKKQVTPYDAALDIVTAIHKFGFQSPEVDQALRVNINQKEDMKTILYIIKVANSYSSAGSKVEELTSFVDGYIAFLNNEEVPENMNEIYYAGNLLARAINNFE